MASGYIKIIDGTPEIYTMSRLMVDNPNTSFPKIMDDQALASFGVFPYFDDGPGQYDKETHRVASATIKQVGGEWRRVYNVEAIPGEEQQALREARKDDLISRFDQPTSIDKVMLKISFLQENRIRALEGKQPITAQQFKDWVRSQID